MIFITGFTSPTTIHFKLITKCDRYQYKVGRLLQSATEKEGYEKVTLKKWLRIASNFIALFPSRLICQLLAIFFFCSWIIKLRVSQSRKRKRKFSSPRKREIRDNHVVVMQWRQRNVQQKRDAREKLLFCQPKPIAFCHCRCRHRFLSSLIMLYITVFIACGGSEDLGGITQLR